jgi:hypothetical protein
VYCSRLAVKHGNGEVIQVNVKAEYSSRSVCLSVCIAVKRPGTAAGGWAEQ